MAKQKKVQVVEMTFDINASAEKVWQITGEDYGNTYKSHPQIISSHYINGSTEGCEGAERKCLFNEKGTKFLQEVQKNFDRENKSFRNQLVHVGKFPMVPEYSYADYRVEPINDTKSRMHVRMQFRTKPAFLGALAKGQLAGLIKDYAISVNHFATTGEEVTAKNFKNIKKNYKAA